MRGRDVGVFAGVMYHDYGAHVTRAPEGTEGYLGTGSAGSVERQPIRQPSPTAAPGGSRALLPMNERLPMRSELNLSALKWIRSTSTVSARTSMFLPANHANGR